MDLKLAGLNVVVTGGTAGIGAEIVECFAREGANVAFCSRSETHVQAMLSRLENYPVKKIGEVLDVLNQDEFTAWIATLGAIDIFVPNVSALSPDWNTSIAVDINATVQTVEAIIPHLAHSKNPVITYIGSKVSTFATPGFEAYGASKSAMTHYMKSLSKRLAEQGIRVNTVSPGDTFVEGGFWDKIKHDSPDVYTATKDANPMKRFCTPLEVANTVVFLSSPLSSFTTGAHVLIDGGATDHIYG